EHAMLTKSVKSVISVVLKHVARAKKSVQSVRSVSILAAQLRFAAFNCKHSAIISEWFNRTAIIYKGLKTEKLRFSV
ncbi:hypothetical protein, partial [Prevotellamassilia timonensis]